MAGEDDTLADASCFLLLIVVVDNMVKVGAEWLNTIVGQPTD